MIVSTIHSSNCMGINLSVGILISWRILIIGEFLLDREKILIGGLLILHLGKESRVQNHHLPFLMKGIILGGFGGQKRKSPLMAKAGRRGRVKNHRLGNPFPPDGATTHPPPTTHRPFRENAKKHPK